MEIEVEIIQIDEKYITLGQFLKHADIISSGGMAKPFLQQFEVYLNGEIEDRRGKKLYHNDIIAIVDVGNFQIESLSHED